MEIINGKNTVGSAKSAAACSVVVRVPRIRARIVLVGLRQGAPLLVHPCGRRVEHDNWGGWSQSCRAYLYWDGGMLLLCWDLVMCWLRVRRWG